MPLIQVVQIAEPMELTKVPSSLPRYADVSEVLENILQIEYHWKWNFINIYRELIVNLLENYFFISDFNEFEI